MLKNLDKLLWPAFTKRQMIDYYRAIAPALLPHLRGRAVTLARFPDGVGGRAGTRAIARTGPRIRSP